ncbi:MAG: 30S ribosomal protein S12 methylthiotransferase RimO, partial [Desulfovibrionaceae bacterium]|nr:30S ribosomal protein S12 methylthiotransferase RimO [Desulfovibrionaceae bacterium]
MKEVRCYSVSLGCPKNRVDTEHFFGSLGIHPLPVDTPDQADLVFVNTCAFIAPAVEESVQTIAQILADLEGEKTRPVIAVAGCLVGRYGVADLAAELPEVDVWLDNREIESWPHKVSAALKIKE